MADDPIAADMTDLAFDEEETVDGVPVLEDAPLPAMRSPHAAARPLTGTGLAAAASPAVQAVAAAATGFVAGAATLALVRRHSSRRHARAAVRGRRGAEGLPIVGTRSFLIDVHLIDKPGE